MAIINKWKDKVSKVGSVVKDKMKDKIEDYKSQVIGYAARINYDKAIERAEPLSDSLPETISFIYVLRDASLEYQESDSPTKEADFLNIIKESVDPVTTLEELEPYVNYIPNGNYLVLILKYLAGRKNRNKQ